MGVDKRDEVRGGVASQRRLGEMRIGRQIAFGTGVDVGEIAATTTRNQDLLAHGLGLVEQQHAATTMPRGRGAQQPGQVGRATRRERVFQYVELSVVAVTLKNNKKAQTD